MRIYVPLLALLAALCAAVPARAVVAQLPGIDICTPVAVQMLDDVDSHTAKPGDFFRFETVNALTNRTHIVVPQRTIGYGIVAVASPAGRGGRAGTLVLEPRYLVLPDGRHAGVVLDHNTSDMVANGKSGDMPGYLGAIPVPMIGAAIGIFNYFHHGKDIEVKRGTMFSIFPADGPPTEKCQVTPTL